MQKLQLTQNHCDVDKQRQKPAEDEEVMEFYDAVMKTKQEEFASVGVISTDDFSLRVQGGSAARRAKWQPDSVLCEAKNKNVQRWCRRYGLQMSARYEMTAHGEIGASLLADHWCQRMQFYYNMYIESQEENFIYTDDHHCCYQEAPDLENFLQSAARASKTRVEQIRAILPSAPSD